MLKSTNVGIAVTVDVCSVWISAKLPVNLSDFPQPVQSVYRISVSNILQSAPYILHIYITEEPLNEFGVP
jgi:hypothetical protein